MMQIKLTPNQAMAVHILATGGSYSDIAAVLNLANKFSAKNFTTEAYKKLGIGGRAGHKKRFLIARNLPGDVVHEASELGKRYLETRKNPAWKDVNNASN